MSRSLLLATLNFPPALGGIEHMCAELARELAGLGIAVHVVAPAQPGDAAIDAALPYRVTRYPAGPVRVANLGLALAPLLRAAPSWVLFAQWSAATPFALRRALGARATKLATLAHGKEYLTAQRGWRATRLWSAHRRAVLSQLAMVLAVSDYTAKHARASGARSVRVTHPGVDAEHFSPAAASRVTRAELGDGGPRPSGAGATAVGPVLLSVARLVPRKGVDTMITALPAVVAMHPGLRYVVVGDGPDRERLSALAAAHGVAAHLRIVGGVSNDQLPAYYASANLFVLASRELPGVADAEGFGIVLLEAQACGTPVIAARSGGMPDALRAGETGLLVPPDDPGALAAAVLELLGDPPRLRAMGEAARAHALAKSWRATARCVAQALGLEAGSAQ
jgi:phosphatidyl-myo-inositol dimannoside synthase